jgi:proteasome activator subunit 4
LDHRPEILRMSELNDSSDLQIYSSAVLYVLSAVAVPDVYVQDILENFVSAIKSSTSWRIRLHALPALVVFFYRNLLSISAEGVTKVMDVLLDCLADENVEVRQMASKVLSGVVRCSQRQSIVPLKVHYTPFSLGGSLILSAALFHSIRRTGSSPWRARSRCLRGGTPRTLSHCGHCTLRSWGCAR